MRERVANEPQPSGAAQVLELPTPHGPARAHVHAVEGARAVLVLGHGANGAITTPDLTLATEVANAAGVTVVLIEQPYRVAGRRSPSPAHQLDAAWIAVVEQLRAGPATRPAGARRRSLLRRPGGVPDGRGDRRRGRAVPRLPAPSPGALGRRRAKTRQPELDAVPVPVLVIQGVRDPFGMPSAPPTGRIVQVAGDHSLKADRATVARRSATGSASGSGADVGPALSAPPR